MGVYVSWWMLLLDLYNGARPSRTCWLVPRMSTWKESTANKVDVAFVCSSFLYSTTHVEKAATIF